MTFGFETTAEEAAAKFQGEIRGKHVLITGASPNSLGAEAARVIAKNGAALVVLAGRNKKNLEETTAAIKKETPNANIRLLDLDLVDLDSVRKAAREVNGYSEPINVLINNAATMATPYRPIPGTDLESQFFGNHIGHFLFTSLIFDKVLAGKQGDVLPRIINVSSSGHGLSPIRFDDMGFEGGKTYDPWVAYGQSKCANVLFSRELAKRYQGKLVAFSLHPGGIQTNLSRDLTPEAQAALMDMLKNLPDFRFKDLGAGTSTHIVAAFDPSIVKDNGAYLEDAHVSEATCVPHGKDMEAAQKLWEISEKIIGQKF